MQTAKDTQSSKESYVMIILLFLTLSILALLFLNIEKHKIINLNLANIKAVDDRTVLGRSIATAVKTNQGIEFSCQIIKSHLDQPYCQLIIDVQDLTRQAPFTGLDLSSYEQVGLWIKHNHPTLPGTRIEFRNFNSAYSIDSDERSLKHNSLEYLEAYVTNPVWFKLHSFSVPQWWNNLYNLSQNKGGTDFSNIYAIAIAPSARAQVQAGNYQLTLERIEVKGKYLATPTLLALLALVWSFALGYMLRRALSPSTIIDSQAISGKQAIKFGAMNDSLTGALNRIGLRKCFDQLTPSNLKNLSLIFINIDHFENLYVNYSKKVIDEVLQQFVNQINNTCRSSDTIIRWENEEFLLVCPDTTLAQSVEVVEKIRISIQDCAWPNNIKLTCSAGVAQMYDEDLNHLILRAKKALYSVKNTGTNKTAAA